MKKLRTFAHQTEANLAKSLLASNGIRAEILGGAGTFTVHVGEKNFETAKSLIEEVLVKDMLLVPPPKRINHFKKGILYALGAPLLVPVVFNYISLNHAYKYWENSHKETDDLLKVLLIVALNIPTYFILKAAFSMVGNIGSMMNLSEGTEL